MSIVDDLKDKVSGMAGDMADGAINKATEAASSTLEGMGSLGETVSGMVEGVADKAKDTAGDVIDAASEKMGA